MRDTVDLVKQNESRNDGLKPKSGKVDLEVEQSKIDFYMSWKDNA